MTIIMNKPSTLFPLLQLRTEAELASDGVDSVSVVAEIWDDSVVDGDLDFAFDDDDAEPTTEIPLEPSVIKWPATVMAGPPTERV